MCVRVCVCVRVGVWVGSMHPYNTFGVMDGKVCVCVCVCGGVGSTHPYNTSTNSCNNDLRAAEMEQIPN